MAWYLENIETEEKVISYSYFNQDRIKEDLLNYFKDNHEAELWFYKECFSDTHVGDSFISVFLLKNGKLCKEVYRGDRTFYKKIHFSNQTLIPLESVETLFDPKTFDCYPMHTDGTPDICAPHNIVKIKTDQHWIDSLSESDLAVIKASGINLK